MSPAIVQQLSNVARLERRVEALEKLVATLASHVGVTKVGRPPNGVVAMTSAERVRLHRAKAKVGGA
jgi:hypothetical protein